jgi:peptidoglycan/LPS O-acetylase OafA/YrhL
MPEENRLRALDGLRAAAALLVVLTHFTTDSGIDNRTTHILGQLGVMVFFCLSGFLMMHVTAGLAPNWPNVLQFWRRRLARVLPLFYLVLAFVAVLSLATVLFGIPRKYVAFNFDAARLLRHAVFIQGSGVFWTIGVEVLFYFLFPILWLARWRSGWLLVLVAAAVLSWQFATGFRYTDNFAPSRLNLTAHFFIAGALTYAAWSSAAWQRLGRGTLEAVFVVVAAAAVLVLGGVADNVLGVTLIQQGFVVFWSSPSVIWLLVPLLVLTIASSRFAAATLGSMPLAFLGGISYSIYLTHRFVLRAATAIPVPPGPGQIALFLLVMLPTVVLVSYLTYTFWEKPARETINGRRRPKIAATTTVSPGES